MVLQFIYFCARCSYCDCGIWLMMTDFVVEFFLGTTVNQQLYVSSANIDIWVSRCHLWRNSLLRDNALVVAYSQWSAKHACHKQQQIVAFVKDNVKVGRHVSCTILHCNLSKLPFAYGTKVARRYKRSEDIIIKWPNLWWRLVGELFFQFVFKEWMWHIVRDFQKHGAYYENAWYDMKRRWNA